MDAPKCRLCGDRHYGICATKSTAARKDVHTVGDRQAGASNAEERKPSNALPGGIAGTQAPPVDTVRPEPGVDHREPPSRPVAKSVKSSVASKTTDGKPGQSRSTNPIAPVVDVDPLTASHGTAGDKDHGPFDRRTYARDYMKEWRKRKTEERSTDRAFVEAARLTLDAETFDKILRLAMEKN